MPMASESPEPVGDVATAPAPIAIVEPDVALPAFAPLPIAMPPPVPAFAPAVAD
ncbi:hypothetical protein OH687_32950 [Burkholderia anthina]|nr:hypothetical protein OH687_32950 [Burkholderia anthina]